MADREVMQMALKALESGLAFSTHSPVLQNLRAALEQPEQEPVQYEMRTRPTWGANSWSDWQKCSKESAGDYIKTPKLHDWLYEVRAIYTQPPQRKPLTDEEIAAIVRVAAKGSAIKRDGSTSQRIARAIEAAHGIKGKP